MDNRFEFDQKSIMDLVNSNEPFSFYFGETKQRVTDEDLQWLGRRSANLPRKKDGKIPRNRPVLLRADTKLPEEKQHFTPVEARKELDFDSILLFCSALCLNAYEVEDALQSKLNHLPLGRKLWREKEADKSPKDGVAYKVFCTFSFGITAAIKEGKCRLQK